MEAETTQKCLVHSASQELLSFRLKVEHVFQGIRHLLQPKLGAFLHSALQCQWRAFAGVDDDVVILLCCHRSEALHEAAGEKVVPRCEPVRFFGWFALKDIFKLDIAWVLALPFRTDSYFHHFLLSDFAEPRHQQRVAVLTFLCLFGENVGGRRALDELSPHVENALELLIHQAVGKKRISRLRGHRPVNQCIDRETNHASGREVGVVVLVGVHLVTWRRSLHECVEQLQKFGKVLNSWLLQWSRWVVPCRLCEHVIGRLVQYRVRFHQQLKISNRLDNFVAKRFGPLSQMQQPGIDKDGVLRQPSGFPFVHHQASHLLWFGPALLCGWRSICSGALLWHDVVCSWL
mmetsp:Transcript_10580/g.15491  ORF Transcript_10580/g.15491 Transcript_10580/m.15491 type:complete len:347 (-) Transcript_10580:37-1077(-)